MQAMQRRVDDPSALPTIRKICTEYLGISRNAQGLTLAMARLAPWVATSDAALVAWLMARAALQRRESRGAHFRTDFPQAETAFAHSQFSEISSMSLAA
jgi:L-aspartate oxidase